SPGSGSAAAPGSPAAPEAARSWLRSPIPEILGYVGAALVASAALNFVAQSWEGWSDTVRITVVAVALALLIGAAAGFTLAAGGPRTLNDGAHDQYRRVVGVCMALATLATGLLVNLIIDASGVPRSEDSDPWILVTALAAFVVAAAGAWLARGVMTTLAIAGASGIVAIGIVNVIGPELAWVWPAVAFAGWAAWMVIAPRILAVPVLAEALGMAGVLVALAPVALAEQRGEPGIPMEPMPDDLLLAMWLARGMLALVAVAGLVLFARGGSWAWAAGGIIAAAVTAMAVAGQALGWVAGLLAAGVVLLVVSGVLLLARRREPDQ
ncbi:MAG: DUF2157 domain-containing protein, partial [bacterium]